MAGRAGRKGFDDEGQAIIIAKDETEAERLFEKYVYAQPEDILSQLGNVPTLRMIMLGLISNDTIYDDKSLINFFNQTFYAICFNNNDELNYKISKVLEELIEFGFAKAEKGIIKITDIGRRVAELYIDPLSANNIISKLNQLKENVDINTILMMIANTYELKPYFRVPKAKQDELFEELQTKYADLGLTFDEISEDWEITEKYFTMQILNDWINEISEQELITKYEIMPGILHNKIAKAKWVAYAITELSQILQNVVGQKIGEKLQKRLEYGVKDELLLLIELPNIGRVRARKLSSKGIKTITDISKANPEIIANIIGNKMTIKLLDHLKISHNLTQKEHKEVQKNLFSY
jgi:helicase